MYGMISVLTVGFGVDIFTLLDERGPQPTAWFCVRLERLLPRPTGQPQQLVDEPAFVRQFAAHEAGGRVAGECAEIPGQMRLIGVAAGLRQLRAARDLVTSRKADRMTEPQDAREPLGRRAELASEAHREV